MSPAPYVISRLNGHDRTTKCRPVKRIPRLNARGSRNPERDAYGKNCPEDRVHNTNA